MSSIPITASMLYDLVACPHRVSMDLFTDPSQRDRVSPFVQLLWDRGVAHEERVVANIAEPFVDLLKYAGSEKERLTLEAMDRGEPLIYGGRISAGDLLGDPDLLRKEGNGYVAGDIKSGAGEESGDEDSETKPKKHYAVQLALYTDILERLGRSAGRRGFIWDIHSKEVIYDFTITYGVRNPRTLWADYEDNLAEARGIVSRVTTTTPAYSSGICKNCVWFSACLKKLEATSDLTLIPELGRSKRDAMIQHISSIKEFAESNPESFISGKKTAFAGIGPPTLEKLYARAKLLSNKDAKPYLRMPISLPASDHELFFDIEVDPMRDVCYLHGFIERINGEIDKERFIFFFADDPTAECEERSFREAWGFLQAARPCRIYYYSKYERTIYRKLRQKYPDVCTEADIESLFDPSQSVDLYFDVVLKATEWPTRDFSIKTLAKYLGFTWRDTHPSGAASIEWFDRWVETHDPAVRQRLLDYNEDDCRATRVLLDSIRGMSV
jgi:predicted RecB family nuclease